MNGREILFSEQELKRVEEGIEKDIKELLSPRKRTVLLIIIASIFIASILTINEINEDLARAIAGSIITVGGLLLGFFILGATSLSDKDFVKAVHEALLRKHITEFLKKAETFYAKSEDDAKHFVKEEISLVAGRTGFSMGVIQGVFYGSIRYLLISIGLAFCLYGVNGSYIFNSWEWILFWFILYLSLGTLFISAYTLLKSIVSLLDRSTSTYSSDTYDLIMKILDEKIKEQDEQKKRNEE